MIREHVVIVAMFVFAVAGERSHSTAQAKDKTERTATVSGVLKSRIELKNSKNVIIEILADGEDKPRRYGVPYVPKGKGPITEVLGAVNKANIGDRVRCDLVYGAYGYESGFIVTTFEVLRKADAKREIGKEK
jgi:hypothetical protein